MISYFRLARFVKSGALCALIFFIHACGPPTIEELFSDFITQRSAELSDFGGNFQKGSYLYISPRNKAEVVRFCKLTAKHKIPYIIAGAQHSKAGQTFPAQNSSNGNVTGPLIILSTSQLTSMTLDAEKNSVTVESGAPMEEVRKFVMQKTQAKALPVFPDSPGPTVGGFAAAGGMNASSFRYGGFWANVKLVEAIYPDGTMATHKPGDAAFPFLFGTAGQVAFVYSLTLQLVKQPKENSEWMVTTSAPGGGPAALLAVSKKLQAQQAVYGLLANWAGPELQFQIRTSASKPSIGSWFGGSLGVKEIRKLDGEPPKIRRMQKWFTLLAQEKDVPRAFGDLSKLYSKYSQQKALTFTGIYTYKIKQTGNMPKAPYVTNHPSDFWKVGIQFLHKAKGTLQVVDTKTTQAKDSAASKHAENIGNHRAPWVIVRNFEADFQKISAQYGHNRYLLSEYYQPNYRFENHWGKKKFSTLRDFKQKHDPHMLMNYRKVFP